jgi:hypothetical protein
MPLLALVSLPQGEEYNPMTLKLKSFCHPALRGGPWALPAGQDHERIRLQDLQKGFDAVSR